MVSRNVGRTRVDTFNPGYALLDELLGLLLKAFTFYPEDLRENRVMNRRLPRLREKPL